MALTERLSLVDRLVDGRYRVKSHLADGGMGSVYVAVDERLDRDVALKVMREDLARDTRFVERFRKEARSAARLGHQHIVAVHDQGEDDGLVFLAMELVPGRTLRDWLCDVGALTPQEALCVIDDVLEALAVAHRAGIIHRDVKPENVLIGDDGVVKVADFGLARAVTSHTATALTGTMLGTVAYLAPEQVERGIADARSDVYAAALMLHEMLTGSPAVQGDSPIHIAYQHVHGTLAAPSSVVPGLPTVLDEMVTVATHRDPDERPADAAAYLDVIRRARERLSPAELAARPVVPARSRPDAADGDAGSGVDATERTGVIARSTSVLPLTAAPSLRTESDTPRSRTAPAGGATAAGRARRRSVMFAVPALILVAALAASWFFLLGPGSLRAVPDLRGQTQVNAVQAVDTAGLRAAVREEFSESVPPDRVISAQPAAGTQERRWSMVTLTVSKGPERYQVPELRGQDAGDVGAALTAAHLNPGATTQAYDEKVPAGQVISSVPAAGSSLRPQTPVAVVVSRGREPIELIDWTGKSLEEAKKALEPRDVTVKVSDQVFDSQILKGSIVSQGTAPSTIHRGDTVSVVISKGPDLVVVPKVSGSSEASARQVLSAAGFTVKVSRIAGGLFGTAHSTDPGAGSKAPRGSTITLRIV